MPTVEFDGSRYRLEYDRPQSIGKIRAFHGVPATVVRSFAWVLSLGAEGLREVAETAVLNNNYLASRLADVRGVNVSFAEANSARRLEQIRYTLAKLQEDTGVGTLDVARRTADFGVATYFPSHEPWVVPEPMTLEPSESYSRADLDDYADIIAEISREAYETPETVLSSAPQHGPQDGPRTVRRSGALGADLAGLPAQVRRHGGFPAARRFDQRHDAGLTRG